MNKPNKISLKTFFFESDQNPKLWEIFTTIVLCAAGLYLLGEAIGKAVGFLGKVSPSKITIAEEGEKGK